MSLGRYELLQQLQVQVSEVLPLFQNMNDIQYLTSLYFEESTLVYSSISLMCCHLPIITIEKLSEVTRSFRPIGGLHEVAFPYYLKENQNAPPRPFEHIPQSGGKMSKRLGGVIGCKYKTSSWHLVTLGQQYNIGEKPTVILCTYINRHEGTTPEKQRKQKHCSTSSNMVVIIYCYKGCEDKTTVHSITVYIKRGQRGP